MTAPRRAGVVLAVVALALAACADEPVTTLPDPEPMEEPEPSEPEPPEVDDDDEEPEDSRPRSPLTGEPTDQDVLDQPPLMIKVDNAPQARPQAGLDAADVVYEEVVEAGVTRFFAIFQRQLPEAVGPIRSARPVDAQLLHGYGPSVFAYSGARDDVIPLLRETPAVILTEGNAGFFRDGGRRAPHNLYVDAAATRAAGEDRGAEPIDDVGWVFEEEPPGGELACPSDAQDCDDPGVAVSIAMSSRFRTGWTYDADAGRYRRQQNGEPYTVTGSGRVGAANVVVLDARHYLGAPSCYGEPCPETDVVTDDAAAIVLRDGARYEARWRKPSQDAPLELLTTDGQPFPLAPGPTWIHMPRTMPSVTD